MTAPNGETWQSIPGYGDRYEASNCGRIRSIPRPGTPGRILHATTAGRTYLRVALIWDGIKRPINVHQLIALAFRGPRPEGLAIRHLDGNPLNNQLSNLVYGTLSENLLDAVRHGTHFQARKTHCKRGHSLMDPANLRPNKSGRDCRACHRQRYQERYSPHARATA